MTALASPHITHSDAARPRFAAADYEAAYLGAIDRALRHAAATQAIADRARRLEAIRGPRQWRAVEVRS